VAALLLAAALGAGCRQDMHDQPRYEPLEASDFFGDGMSARPLIEDTVARGHLRENPALYTGLDSAGQPMAELPVPLTRELLTRGRERFGIYCTPCHGLLGNGEGMVVRRGFKQPTSFHAQRLREEAVGYFFDVATNGFGVMPSYATMIPVEDRWAIAAYIQALQLSQDAPTSVLDEHDLEALEAVSSPQGETAAPETGHQP
jgi:mono/diheme cytochrome c family protein